MTSDGLADISHKNCKSRHHYNAFNGIEHVDRRAEIAFMGITRQQYVQHVQEESTEL